jgi:hypothetical protein
MSQLASLQGTGLRSQVTWGLKTGRQHPCGILERHGTRGPRLRVTRRSLLPTLGSILCLIQPAGFMPWFLLKLHLQDLTPGHWTSSQRHPSPEIAIGHRDLPHPRSGLLP